VSVIQQTGTEPPRGFVRTLADYDTASTINGPIAQRAADRLPLSEWGENARAGMERAAVENPHTGGGRMTPQTVAINWRDHVSGAAYELREAVDAWGATPADGPAFILREKINAARRIIPAARALLRALGELPADTENDAERTDA
jgi:hypothetical protein